MKTITKATTKILIFSSLFLGAFSHAQISCHNSVEKSSAIIIYLLNDINQTYSFTGGGGISEIKEVATGVYRVSLPQEERVDYIQYQVKINKKCEVTIVKKENSTKSFH